MKDPRIIGNTSIVKNADINTITKNSGMKDPRIINTQTNINNIAQPTQRPVNPAANILQNATQIQSYNDVVPQQERPQFKNTSFIDTTAMEQKPQTTEWNESTRQALDREGSPIAKTIANTLILGADTAKAIGYNAVAGMADVIDYGYAGGTKLAGLDASTINAKNLIDYNNGVRQPQKNMALLNPINLIRSNITGAGQTVNKSYEKLKSIHELYPDNIKLTQLYNQITKGTYTGTQQELENTLSTIQIEIAKDFKAKHTDDDEIRAQKQAEKIKEKYGIVGDIFINKGVGTASRMIPTALTSVAFGPTAGKVAIGMQAGGSAYGQALDEGAEFGKAVNYGTGIAILEPTLESVGGDSVNKFLFGGKGRTLTGGWVDNFIKSKGINNTFTKIGLTLVNDISGEAVEEGVSAALEPLIAEITYNPDREFNLKEYGGSIVTAMIDSIPATLFMGGAGKVQTINAVNKYETGLINEINKSTLTDVQKAELIKGVQEKCADARIGLETNFEEIQAEVVRNLQQNPANILQNATQTQTYDEAMQNNVENTQNLQEPPQNMTQIDTTQQNNTQNTLTEELVETNIGKIPVAEYRDIMAQQAGFNDYADMRKNGIKLGNKYDVETKNEQKLPKTENISQESIQNAQNLQENVQNDNKLFREGLEKFKKRDYTAEDDLVLLDTPPEYFYNLGYDSKEKVVINMNKLEEAMREPKGTFDDVNQHGITYDIVEQLPEAINNPLNIIKNPKFRNRFVLVTSLTDQYGDIVIVPIEMDTGGRVLNVNRVNSVYGKEFYDLKKAENIQSYMERNKDNIVYDIDNDIKKRSLITNVHPGLQLSNVTDSSASINNIIPNSENYVNNLLPTTDQLQAQEQKQAEEAYNTLNMKKKTNKNPNFMLTNEGDSYKRNMFKNNAKAINDLIKAKTEVTKELDNKIQEKQKLYNAKKDKTTKTAQNLKTQIINLQKRKADIEEKLIKKIDRLETRNANINKLKKQVSDDRLPTRKEIKENIITETDLKNINLGNAKDISKFIMNNTTPMRVNEKVFDRDTAKQINETFFEPIKRTEAERIRFLNKEREEIKALGIEPKSEESEYVQIYGEGEWVNPSTGESSPYTLEDLKKKFPDSWQKIKKASEIIREKYDTYLDAVNKELNKMGYDSIPKLKNYFRHFEATTSLLDQIGIPSKADHLPTDMNGLTADLKPGKNFFANALSRTGKKTTYDAITGIDGYLEGVSKLIYHTEDIQRLRTFDEYIRSQYGQNANLEGLKPQEFNKKVEQIQDGYLSEYASWLTEYTNNLAGKKSKMDRGTEEALGRRIYGTLNAVKKQVGSNLTGFNLNSALSNFISITQGAAKTSKIGMAEGLYDTVKNIFVDDGFINKSDFLTRRFGSDKLSKTTWEKIANAGQIFMAGTDYFSANLITRSKYHEFLNKGYPEAEAMKKADEFADRIMGGRALGDMPNIFNSKTLGILTQFQLENVNQFDSMFHDTKYEDRASEQTKYEAKTWNEKIKSNLANKKPNFYNGLTATFILGQLFAYAWAYNKIDEEITGSGGAFDPIGIVEDLIKDFTNPNLTKGEALKNLALNVIDAVPYANILTGGGRVPMTDALPNLVDILEGEAGWEEAWKLLNLVAPTGAGQAIKTTKGAIALAQGGDYKTNSKGEKQLKFPIAQEGNVAQRISEGAQALLFGKWATPGGQKYIEDGFKALSAVETQGLEKAQELDMSIKEFYDIMQAIEAIEVPTKKNKEGKDVAVPGARKQLIKDELNSRDLTAEQKKLMYDIFYSKEIK